MVKQLDSALNENTTEDKNTSDLSAMEKKWDAELNNIIDKVSDDKNTADLIKNMMSDVSSIQKKNNFFEEICFNFSMDKLVPNYKNNLSLDEVKKLMEDELEVDIILDAKKKANQLGIKLNWLSGPYNFKSINNAPISIDGKFITIKMNFVKNIIKYMDSDEKMQEYKPYNGFVRFLISMFNCIYLRDKKFTENIDGKLVDYLAYESYDFKEHKIKLFTFSPDSNLINLNFYNMQPMG